jgi:hypothetical protein
MSWRGDDHNEPKVYIIREQQQQQQSRLKMRFEFIFCEPQVVHFVSQIPALTAFDRAEGARNAQHNNSRVLT